MALPPICHRFLRTGIEANITKMQNIERKCRLWYHHRTR
uniref:Uncharacterized protein n=1 Tax=Siphoviridae sp. ctUoe7 TaxID=2826355 RepID=A0A8S5N4N6_9CAUD|nr:MAG TPA: hypothetical protein [Siphoviridae sp. ctUoe7]DAZ57439.1 MAG TPA: hypothetical protein [Caudoviricetes sp.]